MSTKRSRSIKKLKWFSIPIAVALAAILLVLYLPAGVSIEAKGILSLNVGSNLQSIQTVPAWQRGYTSPIISQTSPFNYEMNLSGEIVHIGSAANQFTPILRFNRFGGESYVELNLVGGGSIAHFTTSTLVDGIVTAENSYFILKYSAVGINPGFNELGGIDTVMILKRAPPLNTVSFTYNKQRASAYLQPPLTPEEVAQGSGRPDYVVNSIAFYGDSNQVNNQYKTGKIGHLYRMKVTDSSAVPKTTWADWGFASNQAQITLTIPQSFLDSAVYPVIVAPTGDWFGYTSVGQSYFNFGANYIRACGDTFNGVDGTGDSISIAAWIASGSGNAGLAVYDNASPSNLISNTPSVVFINDDHLTFKTVDFSVAPTFSSALSYYLPWNIDTAGLIVCYDAVGTNNYKSHSDNYGTWDATISWGNGSNIRQFSIYVTYTPSGGGGTTTYSPSGNAGDWTNPINAYSSDNSYATRNPATILNGSAGGSANGTLPWTNPTYVYSSNNQSATAVYPALVYTNSPTSNNGTAWTGPTNAYGDNSVTTNITANNPSGSNIWGNYGFSLTGYTIGQVRVRYDAWSVGYAGGAASQTRVPTSDNTVSGTWTPVPASPTTRYDKVDETTPNNADYIVGIGNNDYITFGFNGFAVPAGSTITNVKVYYTASDNVNGTNKITGQVTVNGTLYTGGTNNEPPNAPTWTTFSSTWTTNPATAGLAWTVDDVNGVGAAIELQGFGVVTSDATPDVNCSMVYAEVNYTPVEYNDIIRVDVSGDGGGTWSYSANTTLTSAEVTTWYDVTNVGITWTPAKLADGQLCVRALAQLVGNAEVVRLDWLPVEVTISSPTFDHIWGTFGISGTGTIDKVEIGYEGWATATQQIDFYTSNNTGSTWSAAHNTGNLGTTDPEAEAWIEVTSDFSWTWTLLNDTNLKVKGVSHWINGTPTWSLDWLTIRVTSHVTTGLTHTYTTYSISLTGDTITKVEVGIEAFAASSEKIGLETTWNAGSDWSASQNSTALGTTDNDTVTWFDFTGTGWTPTTCNDANFQVRITYVDMGSHGQISLDWLPVRITYTTPTNVNYSANQTSYAFGTVATGSTTNTTANWILFTNTSSVSTNISVQMLASTWTANSSGWTHSDSASNTNTAAMKAASGNTTTWQTSVFIKFTAPFNEIGSNIPANSNYVSGLSLLAPISYTNGNSNNNTIRFNFYSSSP